VRKKTRSFFFNSNIKKLFCQEDDNCYESTILEGNMD